MNRKLLLEEVLLVLVSAALGGLFVFMVMV